MRVTIPTKARLKRVFVYFAGLDKQWYARLMYEKKFVYFSMVAMAGVITVSNILVQYPLGQWLTFGALTYPIAFLITDLVTRSQGLVAAKRVILFGLIVGVFASVVASFYDVTTMRIAIASALAFLVAQVLDSTLFFRLKDLVWWQTPVISSTIGSLVDTFIFFSIAFSASTYMLIADGNLWAQEIIPLFGVGPELPLWVSLALADLGVKLCMVLVLLIPYRLFLQSKADINQEAFDR